MPPPPHLLLTCSSPAPHLLLTSSSPPHLLTSSHLHHHLIAPFSPSQVGREKQIGSKEIVDDRERFLELCISRHWQFDELRRAQWSTMMLLALIGGEPE